MAILVNKKTGEERFFNQDELDQALKSGLYTSREGEGVEVVDEFGNFINVSSDEYLQYYSPTVGAAPATREHVAHVREQHRLQQKYDTLGQEILTGLEAAARGLSLGLSDVVLQGLGVDKENMQGRQMINDKIALGGEIGGAIVPTLLTGGTSAGVSGGRLAGQILARAPSAAAIRLGESIAARGVGKSLTSRAIARAAGGAVEGGLFGAGTGVSALALAENPDLSAENLVSSIGGNFLKGAALGAAVGGAFEGVATGMGKVVDIGTDVYEKTAGLASSKGRKIRNAVGKALKNKQKVYDDVLQTIDNNAKASVDLSNQLDDILVKNADLSDTAKLRIEELRENLESAIDVERSFKESLTDEAGNVIDSAFDENADMVADWAFKNQKDLNEAARFISQLTDEPVKKILGKYSKADSLFSKASDLVGLWESINMIPGVNLPSADDIPVVGAPIGYLLAAKYGLKTLLKKAGGALKAFGEVSQNEKVAALVGKAQSKADKVESAVNASKNRLVNSSLSAGEKVAAKVKTAASKVPSVAVPTATILSNNSMTAALEQDSPSKGRQSPPETFNPLVGGSSLRIIKNPQKRSKKPSEREENLKAFLKLKKVMDIHTPSEELGDRVAENALGDLVDDLPEVAASISDVFKRKFDYIKSIIPSDPLSEFTMGDSGWRPSDSQLKKISRVIRVLDNPEIILDGALDSDVSQEEIDAVKTVYPSTFFKMQVGLSEAVQKAGAMNIPRNMRLSLANVFDIPLDPTTTPQFMQTVSQMFESQRSEGGAPQDPQPRVIRGPVEMNQMTRADRLTAK